MNTTPPGWYQDQHGSMRWWDGAAWTEHVAAPAATAAPVSLERPQIAPNAPVDNAWVWVVALVGIATMPMLFIIDWRGYMEASMSLNPSASLQQFGMMMLLYLLSGVVTALMIVAAYQDWKRLKTLGVVRPFHWAFAFIGNIVYLIGRHVVLRKVCRTPGWPLWANVALQVLSLIIVVVWMIWFMSMAMEMVSQYPGYSSYSYSS